MEMTQLKSKSITICLIIGLFLIAGFVEAADGPKWIGAFPINGRVGLKWQSLDGAAEYTVYRKAGSGEFEKLVTTEKTQHFDTEISGGEVYTYKIAATGADGAEVFSIEKKVTIPGSKAGDFKAPNWSGIRFDRNKVMLRWDEVPGAMAYNIYRSETSGGGYEVVGNATMQRYADKEGMENGKTYYYVITALNEEFEETPYSEEQEVVFGTSTAQDAAAEEAAQIVLEDIPLEHLFNITKAGGNADMNQPADVFVNSKGNIFITDALNFQVNCYDNNGSHLFSFGERTPADLVDNPPTGTFSYPFTLFIDKTS